MRQTASVAPDAANATSNSHRRRFVTCTNAGLLRAPRRHQLDYTFRCLELWSVSFTAVTCDNFFLRSVDATYRTNGRSDLRSVADTSARWRLRLAAEVCPTSAPKDDR